MTFSALSYLVWYKKYRHFIMDKVDADDLVEAQTILGDVITEVQTKFAGDIDHLFEVENMQHAQTHLNSALNTKYTDLTRTQQKDKTSGSLDF